MGSIESTIAYGPVYFNTRPNLQLSLSDANILDALTLNIKTHGFNYAPGSELICLSYIIYYKLLSTSNPECKLFDKSNETILVETNFIKSKITTRRPIKWEEINFPDKWILNSAVSQRHAADEATNCILILLKILTEKFVLSLVRNFLFIIADHFLVIELCQIYNIFSLLILLFLLKDHLEVDLYLCTL